MASTSTSTPSPSSYRRGEVVIPDNIQSYLLEITSKKDKQNVATWFAEQQEILENTPVKVGVCGGSGAGKSTLINTMRGLRSPGRNWEPPYPHDPSAPAKVGVTETTVKMQCYRHPEFPSIEFWDLPGCGTPRYPFDSYAKDVKLDTYDLFLIITAQRFTMNDLRLARLIRDEIGKKYFFVRSQIDVDVDNERRRAEDESEKFRLEEDCLEPVRENTLKQLDDLHVDRVYLVSGRLQYRDDFDFPALWDAMVHALPKTQRQILLLSASGWSKALIEAKAKVLRKHLLVYAGGSGAVAMVPVPGLSICVDAGMLVVMAHQFARAFALMPGQIQRVTAQSSNSARYQKSMEIAKKVGRLMTTKGVTKLSVKYAKSMAVEELARLIPGMGTALAGATSAATTYVMGRQLLKEMTALAHELSEEIFEHAHKELRLEASGVQH